MNEKPKSIVEIEQLHNATMEFNKNSLEIKKIYIGLIPAVITLSYVFMTKEEDFTWRVILFLITLIITTGVWLLDAYYYYYQRKLRNMMINEKNKYYGTVDMKLDNSILKSLFNKSHFIYLYFVIISIIVLIVSWVIQ